eukprot:g1999.t1 g1999   contig11:501762-503174(+)
MLFADLSLSEVAARDGDFHYGNVPPEIRLEATVSSGIDPTTELPRVLEIIASVCDEFGTTFTYNNIQANESPSRPESLPGVLGRVLLISIHGVPSDFDVDESVLMSKIKIFLPSILTACPMGREGKTLSLYCLRFDQMLPMTRMLRVSFKRRLQTMVCEMSFTKVLLKALTRTLSFLQHILKSMGQWYKLSHRRLQHISTQSSVLVFDNLVSESLRGRLLNVIKGNPEYYSELEDGWDDTELGPNPKRWVRGGLMDVVGDSSAENNYTADGNCWGLTDEAIIDICFNEHSAIAEFESILSQLFSDFIVSRLPEAVLGECVSPLTGNAPTHGDIFDYHIDADPLQVPPSPWADVFGRYPNRSNGKPRFMSCLLYLNDEWNGKEWEAPTKFLDPPTQQTYEVMPAPGRCVLMDQDISHQVVAPSLEAGKRPRYSLVWKLILHPKQSEQNMKDLTGGRSWPDPKVIGSAMLSS